MKITRAIHPEPTSRLYKALKASGMDSCYTCRFYQPRQHPADPTKQAMLCHNPGMLEIDGSPGEFTDFGACAKFEPALEGCLFV